MKVEYLKKFVQHKLGTDKAWALRALEVVFDNQTNEEQIRESTLINNGIGFTGTDGKILTSIANFYIKNKSVSNKQLQLIFKRIPKYWKQILDKSDQEKLIAMAEQFYEKYKKYKEENTNVKIESKVEVIEGITERHKTLATTFDNCFGYRYTSAGDWLMKLYEWAWDKNADWGNLSNDLLEYLSAEKTRDEIKRKLGI